MIRTTANAELDDFIESFERHYAQSGAADLTGFLPPIDHPLHSQIMSELIRVDLEFSWRDGRRRNIADYLHDYPSLRADDKGLAEICFEEYRLRRRAGETPDPREYATRFGIDVGAWPSVGASTGRRRGSTAVEGGTLNDAQLRHDSPSNMIGELQHSAPELAATLADALAKLPPVGAKFLGFELIEELGRGAFGRVYLAKEKALAGRLVALKLTGDIGAEAAALAQLQHTNIVPVYSITKSRPFEAICMPYCGRTTLAGAITALGHLHQPPISGEFFVETLRDAKREAGYGRFTGHLSHLAEVSYCEAVVWLAARMASGLAHAHDRGILHRDLKPANVLLADDGEPMLLDFNLASDTKLRGTAAAAFFGGTLPYMAPEQLKSFDQPSTLIDARSDVYAFGLILFELLTGRLPFAIPTGPVASICHQLLQERNRPMPRIRTLNRDVSPALESIVRKCLHANPDRRYASARELCEDLERQRDALPLKHAPDRSIRERLGKWVRRHPRLASGYSVAALFLLVLAGTGVFLIRQSQELRQARSQQADVEYRDAMATARLALSAPRPDAFEISRGRGALRLASIRLGEVGDQRRNMNYLSEYFLWLARIEHLTAEQSDDPARRKLGLEQALAYNSNGALHDFDGRWKRTFALQKACLEENPGAVQDALQIPCKNAMDELMTGVLLMNRGQTAAAKSYLQNACRLDPAMPQAWYAYGLYLADAEKHDEAIGCFNACIALRPDYAAAHHLRGCSFFKLNQLADALRDLDQSIVLDPMPSAQADRALVHLKNGNADRAIEDLTTAINARPNDTRWYFQRARAYTMRGDGESAARDIDAGFKAKPATDEDYIVRAAARLPGKPQLALSDIDACLSRFPKSAHAHQARAHILSEHMNQTREAIAALDKAIDAQPDFALAFAGRGVLRARLGQFDGARSDAERALQLSDKPLVVYQVAGIYALSSKERPEDRNRAIFLLSQAIHQDCGLDLVDNDPDLQQIRSSPEVRSLLAEAKALKK